MSETEENEDTTGTPKPKKSGGGQTVQAPRKTIFKLKPSELTIIGIDTKDGPEHPLYDPRINLPLRPEMQASIRVRGVLEVVKAVKVDGKVVVYSGIQRTKNARVVEAEMAAAGEGELRMSVEVTSDDLPTAFIKGAIANRHRTDDGILASARTAKKAIDMGGTVQSVAIDLGVSDQTVHNWLQLLTLDPKVIEAMEAEELGTTAGLMLAKLPAADQVAQLADLKKDVAAGNKVTVASTRAKVKARAAGAPAPENRVTPKQRVEKAVSILIKTSGGPSTKEAYAEALNKLSRALAGKSFDKLAETEE